MNVGNTFKREYHKNHGYGIKKVNNEYRLLIILMCIYIILKMYRNSINFEDESIGGIWNVITAGFFIWSIFSLYLNHGENNRYPPCMRYGVLYTGFAWLSSLLNVNGGITLSFVYYFAMIPYFICLLIISYNASMKEINPNEKKLTFLLMYIVIGFALYLMVNRKTNSMAVSQSDAYFALSFLPFVFLWGKKLHFYMPFLLIASALIFSEKRNGTLALIFSLLVYFIIDLYMNKDLKGFSKTILRISIITAIVIFGYNYLSSLFSINLLERFETLSSDGGSSRDVIYTGIWNEIKQSDLYHWIIGYGNRGITMIYGRSSSAHNDFLEIMYDYGIFAVLSFAAFYLSMIVTCFKMIRAKFEGSKAFAASLIISLMMSMFSNYAITFTHISTVAVFWGVLFAEWNAFKKNNIEGSSV